MSSTWYVPAAVPSEAHNSRPDAAVTAVKKARLPRPPSNFGFELLAPATMSDTMNVPSAVPSLRHSSLPEAAVVAEK